MIDGNLWCADFPKSGCASTLHAFAGITLSYDAVKTGPPNYPT